jgi:beta-glucosidase
MRLVAGLVVALGATCALTTGELSTQALAAPPEVAARVHPDRWPVVARPPVAGPEVERRVEELLGRMSIEEKVGQVIQAEIGQVKPAQVRRYRLGSVLNGGGSFPGGNTRAKARDWLALADAFYDASVDSSDGGVAIPVIWGADAVHGHTNVIGATVFPHNIGLGATRDPELIRRIGEITAIEMRVTGLDWNFSPTVAVVRDDRWGRTYEGFSEDPEVVRACAAAMVLGLQGMPGTPEFLDARHVIATAKHFLGDGGTAGGRDQGDNRSSEEELRDIHAAGYVAALEAGVQTVMASFSSWHGRKMHGNRDLLTFVLKERMGFDGFIVGDWNGHGQLPGCSDGDCPAVLVAGVDMFMVPNRWKALYKNTLAQAKSGAIPSVRLDDAVRRILRVKVRARVLDQGRPSSRPLAGRAELLGSPEHRAVARRAVRQSLVLLKNNGKLLPLRRDLNVLVAGDTADSIPRQCGGWTVSWQGTETTNANFPGATSVWQGIRQAVEGAAGKATLSVDGRFTSRPDVAIVVFGEEPYAETDGDRSDLDYGAARPRDRELLRRLHAAGVPVVSLFLSGRPMWVNPELNASDAFAAAWLPGTEGAGVADLLFRSADGSVAHDFSGRLAYSWPRWPDGPAPNRGDPDHDALFPFGFGLSVTDDGELPALPEGNRAGVSSSSQGGTR